MSLKGHAREGLTAVASPGVALVKRQQKAVVRSKLGAYQFAKLWKKVKTLGLRSRRPEATRSVRMSWMSNRSTG